MKKKTKLPNKLSKLIELALNDLVKCENDPNYKIDMDTWHEPNGACKVCFAGSVMAKTCQIELAADIDIYYDKFNNTDWNKFKALNFSRDGCFSSALTQLGFDFNNNDIINDLPDCLHFPKYYNDPRAFKNIMAFCAGILAYYNL